MPALVDPVPIVNPILSYDPVDSPSTANAPFAQKVADMISKNQEPVASAISLTSKAAVNNDDVYGLEQNAISASVNAVAQQH